MLHTKPDETKGAIKFFHENALNIRRYGIFFPIFFVSKGSPFDFLEVFPRHIRNEALYPNF